MSQVAATFGSTAMEIATPTRWQCAVQMVSADKTLSIPIRLCAMKLFTKDIAVCDSYLAIKDADLCNSFLTDLLESEVFWIFNTAVLIVNAVFLDTLCNLPTFI